MLLRMRHPHPAPYSQPGRGAGSPRSSRPPPPLLSCRPRIAVHVGGDCRVVGPTRAVSGAGALCAAAAAEGPAQRKREYPPPFPSALSPQARPLAAA